MAIAVPDAIHGREARKGGKRLRLSSGRSPWRAGRRDAVRSYTHRSRDETGHGPKVTNGEARRLPLQGARCPNGHLRKHRGCGGILPIPEFAPLLIPNSLLTAHYPLFPIFSFSSALFCTLLHSFALTQISTLLFSSACALFAQKTECGGEATPHNSPAGSILWVAL